MTFANKNNGGIAAKSKIEDTQPPIGSVKLLCRTDSRHRVFPEKEEVRNRWYEAIDDTYPKRRESLAEVRSMFERFVLLLDEPDPNTFKDMDKTGWRSTGELLGLLFKGTIDRSKSKGIDMVFSEISAESSIIVAANMVSGMPYAAAIVSYLRRIGVDVHIVFLSYSTRHSVTFSTGGTMQEKVYVPEEAHLRNNPNTAVILADDMIRTQNSMDNVSDVLKKIGMKQIFRTTPADLSGDRPLGVWDGKVTSYLWNNDLKGWEKREIPSEELRDAQGNFRNERKFQ